MTIKEVTPDLVQSSFRSIFLGETPELPFYSVMIYLCQHDLPKPRKLRKPRPKTDFASFAAGLHALIDPRVEGEVA